MTIYPTRKLYPRTLKVAGRDWKVRFVNKIEDGTKARDTIGLCDPYDATLFILAGQSPEERFVTFVHEFLHALEEEYEFELGHRVIRKLEGPLAKFLLDNADELAVMGAVLEAG